MFSYILRKLLIAIPVLTLVSSVVFMIVRLVPSDPVSLIVPITASAEERERVTRKLGLDQPVPVQFFRYISYAAQGDFGRSYRLGIEVKTLVAERAWNTLKLGGLSLFLSYLLGIPLGIIAASHHGKSVEKPIMVLAYVGQAIPSFVLGLLLIVVFARFLGWFPASGYTSAKHFVLPTFALTLAGLTLTVRVMRTSMLEVLRSDYIRTARAKGAGERSVIWWHAQRNALLSTITVFALRLGLILEGAVTVEVIFGWPGAGNLLVDAVSSRDYPLIQGVVLIMAVGVVLANLIADILYAYADPRIRF